MVHIICRHCKLIIHLESNRYWNFKGMAKCSYCGRDMEVEIKNGECIKQKAED